MKPAPLVDQADKATWRALVQPAHDAPHGYKAQARRRLEAAAKGRRAA